MKQKFLNELSKELTFLTPSEKKKVVDKYRNKITKIKKKKNKKIKDIIESLGNIDKIVKKEAFKKKIKDKKFGLVIIKDILLFIPICLKKSYYRVFKLIKRDRKIKIEKDIEREIKETRDIKNKNIISKLFLNIILMLLCILLLILLSISTCLLFAIFDKVKVYALLIIFISLSVMCIETIYLIERLLKKKIIRFRKEFKVFITCLIFIGISIGIVIVQYNNLEFINDVNSKYTMTVNKKEIKINNFRKNYYIRFNSWYKPNYIIEYDNDLNDELIIEIKYYECFYDINYKKDLDSVYISLSENNRDKLSFYIENLKENKIYSSKELSRYTILIKLNEKNKDRIIFEKQL